MAIGLLKLPNLEKFISFRLLHSFFHLCRNKKLNWFLIIFVIQCWF